MGVQSLAEVNFNPEKEEISVLSKHNFCGHGKRIVGAVSVIFIQNDNKYSSNGKSDDEIFPSGGKLSKAETAKIPTSLSVIYLPQFEDISIPCNISSADTNISSTDTAASVQGNLDESLGNLVTKKLVENLDYSTYEKNGMQLNKNNDNISQNDMSNNEIQPDRVVQSDISTTREDAQENELNDFKEHFNGCQKCGLRELVDVSTSTEMLIGNVEGAEESKKCVDASTNTSLDTEEDFCTPLKRKRIRSDEISATDQDVNECASMFIITENKSSSEEDSESQDSVELESTDSHIEPIESKNCNTTNNKLPLKFTNLADEEQSKDSSMSSELFVNQNKSNMKMAIANKGRDISNEGFENSGNVSVVDLSNIPVSFANLPSEQSSKSSSENIDSGYKPSANNFNSQSVSNYNIKPESSDDLQPSYQHLVPGNPRTKFVRSTSISKVANKNTIDKCKICRRTVTSLADMFHHSKIHNMGIKCCVCGMKAFDWSVMKHHYTWHLQRIAFKCPQCSATFGSRDLLAAHIKTHSGAKSMVHLKNPKLRPPASKFIVSQTRTNQYDTSPNTNRYLANSNKGQSSVGGHKFTPFKQHMASTPEHGFKTEQIQCKLSNQFDSSHPQNVNQILNYSCGCCDEKFVNVEKLKRHVLMFHSEQTMSDHMSDSNFTSETHSDASFHMFDTASTSNINFVEGKHSTSSSATPSYTGENARMNMITIKKEDPEIIDIEQLGKFTENFENSMSTNSSDQFSHMPDHDQIEQDIMSSLMETSLEKLSPSNRQRKTACRLANVIPVCRFCGIYLNNWNEILEHRFAHPEQVGQQLACTVCSSVLSTRDSLKRHAINHMGIRHQCHFCHHEYSRKDSLMNHMRSAHGYSNHA